MRTYRRNDDTLCCSNEEEEEVSYIDFIHGTRDTRVKADNVTSLIQRMIRTNHRPFVRSNGKITYFKRARNFQLFDEGRVENDPTMHSTYQSNFLRSALEIHGLSSTSRATIIIESSTFQFLSGIGSRIDVHGSIPSKLFSSPRLHLPRGIARDYRGRGEWYSWWWFNPWAGVIDLLPSIELPEILLHPRVWKRIDSTAANKHHGERD